MAPSVQHDNQCSRISPATSICSTIVADSLALVQSGVTASEHAEQALRAVTSAIDAICVISYIALPTYYDAWLGMHRVQRGQPVRDRQVTGFRGESYRCRKEGNHGAIR
jgi:fumarate reductase subunit D